MGAFITIGDQLVDHEELQDQLARGRWQDFTKDIDAGKDVSVSVGERSIRRSNLDMRHTGGARRRGSAETPEFTKIGIGKPLSIEILTVYTGDKPGRRTADMLAVSGVKSIETHDAAPRAVNQLVGNVSDRQTLEPSAFVNGSPIVYYSPALLNDTVLVSLELVADSFKDSVFQQIRGLFSSAAGLPIFAPASSVLLAGSFVLGAVGTLGKALFETEPFLRANIPLRFDTPGFPVSLARHLVLCNDRNHAELSRLDVRVTSSISGGSRAELFDRTSDRVYSGNAPYIIVSLDGRQRTGLEQFTPTLTSAALLEKFYRANDVAGTAIGVLKDALTFYNDYQFRTKAERLRKEADGLTDGDPRLAELQNLIRAYNENIQTEELRL